MRKTLLDIFNFLIRNIRASIHQEHFYLLNDFDSICVYKKSILFNVKNRLQLFD